MTRIHQKRIKDRCTLCKRRKFVALREQSIKREMCQSRDCEFIGEIAEEIEKALKLTIVPIPRKIMRILEKERPRIPIIKRR